MEEEGERRGREKEKEKEIEIKRGIGQLCVKCERYRSSLKHKRAARER